MNIDLNSDVFKGDHLGVQTENTDDYEEIFKLLSSYTDFLFTNVLHDRRVSMFSFKKELKIEGIALKGIEIFEPKPNADVPKLKLGIEHIAFVVSNFDVFAASFPKKYIAKQSRYNEGQFLKTKFQNLIEIEFREKSLI